MIPKKIHYIWLGGNKKNKLTEVCINSWYRCLEEYEIIEWNEESFNLFELCSKNRFLKKCYDLKLWAFVSDYLRLYILYNEGGIYLDTDVEVLDSFDSLLSNKLFLGYEDNGYIGTGIIGAEKGNPTIKRILDFYNNEIWNVDFYNNPIIFKFLYDNYPDSFKECIILPQTVFAPYSPENKYTNKVEKEDTLAIHWYTGTWNLSRKGYIFLNTKHIKQPFKLIISKIKKSIGYRLRKKR